MTRYRIWLRSSTHRDIPRYRDIRGAADVAAREHAGRFLREANATSLKVDPYDQWEVREIGPTGRESRLVARGDLSAPR